MEFLTAILAFFMSFLPAADPSLLEPPPIQVGASVLKVRQGGTGTSTAPSYGQLLTGDGSNAYTLTATSSLGLLTTNVAEGTSLYYTDARVNSYIHGSSTVPKTYTSNTFGGTQTFTNAISGDVTGNAGTATALETARNINGVSFDGTGNITITAASSTLLSNTNTWSALQKFANVTTDGATTTSLGVSNLTSASCDVKSTTDGVLYCGTDLSGSGSGLSTSTVIADEYMIYGTGALTVGGEAAFTYDDADDRMTLLYASTTGLSSAYASSTQGFFGSLDVTGETESAYFTSISTASTATSTFPLLTVTNIPSYDSEAVTFNTRWMQFGPTHYPANYVTSCDNCSFLVMDKDAEADDTSIVFRDRGDARAEIGLVGDNALHIKTVTGSFGSESFSDALVATNQRVGIGGITDPATALDVLGTASTTNLVVGGGSGVLTVTADSDGGDYNISSQNGSQTLAFYGSAGNTLNLNLLDGSLTVGALSNGLLSASSGLISGGASVASSDITDDTIVNADINSSAAIAYSKLNLTGNLVVGDLSSADFGDWTCNGSACTIDAAAVGTSEVQNDSLLAADLDATNAEADNDIVTFDVGSGGFTFNSGPELCEAITGGSGLCDGDDASGSGMASYDAWTHPNAGDSATTSEMIFNSASSTVSGTLHLHQASTTNFNSIRFAHLHAGSDIGAKINTAYAAGSADGVEIIVSESGSFSTAIAITSEDKPAMIRCLPGVTLTYSGSATSTTFDYGAASVSSEGAQYNAGMSGCKLVGPSKTGGTHGIAIGGQYGAQGVILEGNFVTAFGTALETTANTWGIHVINNFFSENNRAVEIESPSNSGENMSFISNTFADGAENVEGTETCFLANGDGTASLNLTDNAFDDCFFTQRYGNLSTSFQGGHFENPWPAGHGAATWITNETTEGILLIDGIVFYNGATNPVHLPFQYIKNYGQLKVDALSIVQENSIAPTTTIQNFGSTAYATVNGLNQATTDTANIATSSLSYTLNDMGTTTVESTQGFDWGDGTNGARLIPGATTTWEYY